MKRFFTLALLWSSFQVFSQLPCGTPDQSLASESERQQRAASFQTLQMWRQSQGSQTLALPIKPHLLANADGSGAVSHRQLNDALAELNRVFQPLQIVFYFSGTTFSQYLNTAVNQGEVTDAQTFDFHLQHRVANAINLYVAGTVKSGGNVVGGYAFLTPTWSDYNRVWVSTGQLNDDKTTPHEFGHYFGLSHTFNHSDSDNLSWRELVTRNFNEPAPRLDANCLTAGDFICDTESDPFNVSPAAGNCFYNGLETDLNGDLFHPQVNNYLDYRWCGPYAMTPGQYNRMESGAMIVTNANDFTLNAPQTIQDAPANVMASNENYRIRVSWDDISEVETGFIIERAENQNGPFTPIAGVEANITFYDDLTGITGQTYFYRLKPSNSALNYSQITQGVIAPGCGNINSGSCVAVAADEPGWYLERFNLALGESTVILNEQSGCSDGAIGDFYQNTQGFVSPLDELTVTLRSKTGAGNLGYNVIGKVWVDWNQDMVFSEDELMLNAGPSFAQVSGTFILPAGLAEGDYRLRAGISAGSIIDPCWVDFGELEDYRLTYVPMGIADVQQRPLRLYPNPAGDRIFLSGLTASGQKVILMEVTGKKLGEFEWTEQGVDVSGLAPGCYFLILETPDSRQSLKFLKR